MRLSSIVVAAGAVAFSLTLAACSPGGGKDGLVQACLQSYSNVENCTCVADRLVAAADQEVIDTYLRLQSLKGSDKMDAAAKLSDEFRSRYLQSVQAAQQPCMS